ncbi:MAG: carbohydrate-binding family 9-like protein [Pyrinomonadaceae bacterium]|nr:carbohydrate-binding family 9-like protein [Pyrinomonadaceae bacterium]
MTNQPPAEIEAPWIASDIRANDIESPLWLSANPVAVTRQWSGEVAPPSRHAEACILWTNQALCVRFVCRQTEPLIISSKPLLHEKSIGLWNRDVCEIFIAPDPRTPEDYFEFEAAPTGEWIDLAISFEGTTRKTDFEFESGMTVSASIVGEQLTVAMRIPWSDVIPKPEKGQRWRVNLFRCVGTGNERYLAWQPTYTAEPNFHVPEVFGWLKFV